MSRFSGNRDSRRQTRRTLAVIVTVGLLLTACGGGGSSSAASSSASPSASPGSTSSASSSGQRTPEQLAADQKAAEASVLKLSDFPAGWDSKPPDPAIASSPEGEAATTQLGQCLQVDPAPILSDRPDSTKAYAQSDIFTDSQSLQASSDSTVAPSTEEVAAVFSALQRPEAGGCMKDYISAGVSYSLAHPDPGSQQPKNVTMGNIDVAQVNLPDIHGESVTYRLTISLNAGSQTTDLVFDVEFAAKGRNAMTMSLSNFNDPFPQGMEVQLSNAVIDRAPAS